MQLYFDRNLLPSPEAVLRQLTADVWVRGRQLMARCPFPDHADKHPSFSMHALSGSWRCFGCHRHGGDSLALYMNVTGLPFRDAAKALGAWRAA